MRKVLIYLETEFHYLVAKSIIKDYYNQPDIEITLLLNFIDNKRVRRLSNVDFDEDVIRIERGAGTGENSYSVDEAIQRIKKEELYHFVSFLNHDPLTVYLTYYFKSTDTICALAPDGTGSYNRYTPFFMKSRLKLTTGIYKFFIKHRLFYPRLNLFHFEYGCNTDHDFLYSFGGKLPTNYKGVAVKEVDYSLDSDIKRKMMKAFDIKSFDNYPRENIVLIMGQEYQGSERFEQEVIDRIRKISTTIPIIYKKHPVQSSGKLKFLKEYDNIILIDKVFPAELLISELKNSLILSAFSTSSFFKNSSCSFFWLYPLNESESTKDGKVDITKPKEHIQIIKTFDHFEQSLAGHLSNSKGKYKKKGIELAAI